MIIRLVLYLYIFTEINLDSTSYYTCIMCKTIFTMDHNNKTSRGKNIFMTLVRQKLIKLDRQRTAYHKGPATLYFIKRIKDTTKKIKNQVIDWERYSQYFYLTKDLY